MCLQGIIPQPVITEREKTLNNLRPYPAIMTIAGHPLSEFTNRELIEILDKKLRNKAPGEYLESLSDITTELIRRSDNVREYNRKYTKEYRLRQEAALRKKYGGQNEPG